MTIRVTPETWAGAVEVLLRRQAKVWQDVALLEAAHRLRAKAIQITNRKRIVDQGAYKNGWKVRKITDGVVLANDAPYAGVIEFGRRAGAPGPPLAPIQEWVNRKFPGTDAEKRSLAFVIRRSIHEKGTPPKFVMRTTLKHAPKFIREAFAQHRVRG